MASTATTRTLRPRVAKPTGTTTLSSTSASSLHVKRKRASVTTTKKKKNAKKSRGKHDNDSDNDQDTNDSDNDNDINDDNDNDTQRQSSSKSSKPKSAPYNFTKFGISRSNDVRASSSTIDRQLTVEFNDWYQRTAKSASSSASPKVRVTRATDKSKSSTNGNDTDGDHKEKKNKKNDNDNDDKAAQLAKLRNAVSSCVILAQEEAGSAVCVSPDGHILTCAHCIDEHASGVGAVHEVIFADGSLYSAVCTHYDATLDCALLIIQHAHASSASSSTSPVRYPHINVNVSSSNGDNSMLPAAGTPVMCVGQPGRDDLESKKTRATNYPFMNVSFGELRGYELPPAVAAKKKKEKKKSNTTKKTTCNDDTRGGDNDNGKGKGNDYLDNSEIGCLKHNAWTYWGHSGAPLIDAATCTLVGMHNSWDDTTGMRRGVPLAAIHHFLTHASIIPSSTPSSATPTPPVAAASDAVVS